GPELFVSRVNHELPQELGWLRNLLAPALVRVDRERVLGTRHGNVEKAPLFFFVQRFVIIRRRVRPAQFRRKSNERLMVASREPIGRTTHDGDVPELKSLGGVRGQQAHSVVLDARKGNCASCLAKTIEVLEEFRRAPSFGNGFLVPCLHELQKRDYQSRP